MKTVGSPGTTVDKQSAVAQWEQHPTNLSPIGHELVLEGPQQYPIRFCRLGGRSPRGFSSGGGWFVCLYIITTALSGTVRILDGKKVRRNLTFSHGQ